MITQNTINQFAAERKGSGDFVIVEGLHACKHAYRFGGIFDVVYINTDDEKVDARLREYGGEDFSIEMISQATKISKEDFELLAPQAARTGIVARVKKPDHTLDKGRLVVALENPRDLDNVGAVMRVAAAKGVGGVIVSGPTNPWHANAIRAGAGLQFAQPIIHIEDLREFLSAQNIPVISCSDEGEDMYDVTTSTDSILVFGTERDGIDPKTKQMSDQIIAAPMQDGVSSMNLATSVSAILFGANFK